MLIFNILDLFHNFSKQKQKSPYEKSHSLVTNSLFHTVGYKNHSVGYIFHSVGYKSRTAKQRI